MKKNLKKVLYFIGHIITIIFGVFVFIYGGYDDSPGAQLLGLIIFIIGFRNLINIIKKNRLNREL